MTVGRTLLRSFLVVAALAGGLQAAFPDEWHTTSSLIGPSKYGENFQRYDYVNPDAPKGGTLNATASGTFDTFNPFILKGDAATGLGLLFDSLMVRSGDDPDEKAGEQCADDGAKADAFDVHAADDRPQKDAEEQAQDGGLVKE